MVPGLTILQPRAWGELATVQPIGWVTQWTVNVIPPSPLITVYVPCWDTPFRKALGNKWGTLHHHPSNLASLFSVPLPAAS